MAKLKFGSSYVYNPQFLKSFDIGELKDEYNRLRKIANKRLAALSRSEFADSQTYLKNRGKYNKTATQMSRRELLDALSAVGHFVAAKTGSVRGLQAARNKAIESLRKPRDPETGERLTDPETGEPVQGYTFINKSNFKLFTQFMEAYKDANPPAEGSPTPEELRNILAPGKKRLSAEDAKAAFEKYLLDHGYTDILG